MGEPKSGRLYSTEHGPSGFQGCCRDEVNLIEPGKNYGWPEIRGDETKAGMMSPVIQAGTSETWAPGGATFVSKGPWAGSLLFTGLRGQTLYRVILDASDPRKAPKLERHFSPAVRAPARYHRSGGWKFVPFNQQPRRTRQSRLR